MDIHRKLGVLEQRAKVDGGYWNSGRTVSMGRHVNCGTWNRGQKCGSWNSGLMGGYAKGGF